MNSWGLPDMETGQFRAWWKMQAARRYRFVPKNGDSTGIAILSEQREREISRRKPVTL
jgi:hypothetical protein